MRNPFKPKPTKPSKAKKTDSVLPSEVSLKPLSSKSKKPLAYEDKSRLANTLLMLFVAIAAGFGGGYFGSRNNSYDTMSTQAKQQIILTKAS